MASKITIITTTQPSINPRLVKEASALAGRGFNVTVLYCFRSDWAMQQDKEIIKNSEWSALLVGGTPSTNNFLWNFTWIRRKICSLLPWFNEALFRIHAQAYDELVSAGIKEKAHLYIGHNPGALPIVARIAKVTGSIFAFDLEDFHSGELEFQHRNSKLIRKIEAKFLSQAKYLSAASPLIADKYTEVYNLMRPPLCLNNTFSLSKQPVFQKDKPVNPLKLIWFSQKLGRDRGIQDVLLALEELKDIAIYIGLLGQCSSRDAIFFKSFIKSKLHTIDVLEPCTETELILQCSRFHIGLALERNTPINRDICLTNKIFTYLLAGNAILASNTKGQTQFIEQYSGIGQIYPIEDIKALANILRKWNEDAESLNAMRRQAWELANTELNWEKEQIKFINQIESVL